MFFGSELPLSLYFPVLLLGTRSLEIEALGTALEVLKGLEVLEVDVLEDDAIFGIYSMVEYHVMHWKQVFVYTLLTSGTSLT